LQCSRKAFSSKFTCTYSFLFLEICQFSKLEIKSGSSICQESVTITKKASEKSLNNITSFQESINMSKKVSKKSLENFMYDNKELQEIKSKKGCEELSLDLDVDSEVWLLQCPKSFDPTSLINQQLSKLDPKLEYNAVADRFESNKTLALIAPEKAKEYELFCDKLKIVS
jgi:hypothetical protein